MPSASADDASMLVPGDRIYQEFVPAENPDDNLVFEASPIEKLPEPKPKPEPKPEPEEEETQAPEQQAPTQELPLYTGGGAPAEWMAAAGIPESDWGYVDFIASKESGWNPNATNASSGACGLIQANPCSKVPGNGYDPVDNLRWAHGYATGRYGGWAQAYQFWTANHWW
ncbi:transglycosylase SLT domain-containing protein [Leucobacter sp. CSA1]|uniref:Transglycosylase SLT domain-containing protein n=2 Tax=Leucobacter chromiisoli TaxID=2796471 RepID=A0A934Q9L6_9MICO|nr:transglycosylase SLT domain-containing protein [Leucobacter chromiisoli]